MNEAYQAALNKMNTDYDDVEKRIEAIKVDLNTLKKQITDILVDAEGRISAIGKTVTDEVDVALEKFKEGNFYTKQEADNRFLSKTENLEIQNKKLTNDDGSGLPLPKGVTSFKELSGYAGFYYLNATVAGTMTDKADLPTEFKYSALYVYQHAIAGTAGAMYQEIRMNSLTTPLIAFRTTSPNSSQNSPFKILATTDSVVNSTDIENGLFVIKNSKISDLNDAVEPGIYSISATGVENKPLPNSGSLIVNKDQGGIRQQFQTERTIFIRQFGGIPSNWTDWKEVAFITNVVNLTEPQSIAGTKNFIERPLVGGIEVATVDQLENEVILNTRSIGLADGVVALLDSIENYEALRIEYSYQSNSSSAQKIHLKSQSLTFRFSAINIYDDPASKGYDLLESLVDINKNQVKFNYSKVVAYTGAITEEKNWARIDCIIGIRRAPKLYKK